MDKSQSKNPQYFEGFLQLRNCSREVSDFVRRLTLKHPTAFISKEKKVKNGIDFSFSDNKFLRALGKKLQESFVGQVKTSATLHTRDRQRSKDLHRLTVLFRELHFKKGDVLIYQGEEVKVIKIGNDVLVQELKSGKKAHISLEEAEDAAEYTARIR